MNLTNHFRHAWGMGCIAAALLAALLPGPFPPAAAASAVHSSRPLTLYLVRHAEKLNDRDDSPLTAQGKEYARGLAVLLRDRGITRILTSDLRRARDTARPLAQLLRTRGRRFLWSNLSSDEPHVIERTLGRIRDGNAVLLVGRSSFIPELVRDLTGHDVRHDRDLYYRIYHLVRQNGQRFPFTLKEGPAWTPITPRSAGRKAA